MDRSSVCFRCCVALLRGARKEVPSRRFFHESTHRLAKQARAAPAVTRKSHLRLLGIEKDFKELRPNPTPFSDDAVRNYFQELSSAFPEQVRGQTKFLSEAIDPSTVPRMLLFIRMGTAALGSQTTWTSSVQEQFETLKRVDQIHQAACALVKHSGDRQTGTVARLLLYCCAQSGHGEAILDLGVSCSNLSYHQASNYISGPQYRQVKELLEQIASDGDIRAASLVAELAEQDNGPKASIHLWEKAVSIANKQSSEDSVSSPRFNHLKQPWIRAAEIKSSIMNDHSGANALLRVGMKLDDPDAYSAFSRQNSRSRYGKAPEYLEWVNAVTKSAATGSFKSALDLGRHCADDPAVDLSDYTASQSSSGPQRYQHQVAAYASAAKTPRDRLRLAIKWLEVAAQQGSVAALIDLAILHSRRFIYPSENLNSSIKHPNQFDAGTLSTPTDRNDGTSNRFYDPKAVREYLETISKFRKTLVFVREANSKRATEGLKPLLLQEKRQAAPEWYLFPDVAAANEHNAESDWRMVEHISDTLGVDIWPEGDDEPAYLHRGKRSAGICEDARAAGSVTHAGTPSRASSVP